MSEVLEVIRLMLLNLHGIGEFQNFTRLKDVDIITTREEKIKVLRDHATQGEITCRNL